MATCTAPAVSSISSAADALTKAIQELHSLECKAKDLRDTKERQTANLTEVIAENAEKKKIGTVIDLLKSFDQSKIKVSGATVHPITNDIINALQSYHTQLFTTRRYDDDAKGFVDQTAADIIATDKQLEEVRARIVYLKVSYNREKERLLNMIRDTDALLECADKPCVAGACAGACCSCASANATCANATCAAKAP